MKTTFYISIMTLILSGIMSLAVSCSLSSPKTEAIDSTNIRIERFDSLQYLFLATGDYSAMQKMKTTYPNETRILIENILKLGPANSRNISERMLSFYGDSTLQILIGDVASKYSDLSDVNKQLSDCFVRLQKKMPDLAIPKYYAQVGAFCESVVVGNDNSVGICLDKYMGKDYVLYKRFYTEEQRETMTRENIVPDCISFYLLSLYQLPNFETSTQVERDRHIACIQWVVNYSMGKTFFNTPEVKSVDTYMKKTTKVTFDELLKKGILEG